MDSNLRGESDGVVNELSDGVDANRARFNARPRTTLYRVYMLTDNTAYFAPSQDQTRGTAAGLWKRCVTICSQLELGCDRS